MSKMHSITIVFGQDAVQQYADGITDKTLL